MPAAISRKLKMPFVAFLFFITLTSFPMPIQASTAWEEMLQDFERIGTSPIRIGPSDVIYLLPMGGAGYWLTTQDLAIAQNIRKEQNSTLDTLAGIGNTFGDGYVGLSAMALLMTFGGEHDQRVGKSGVLAFLEAGVVTQVFKNLTGRLRPSASPNDSNQWLGPRLGSLAFPSGHVVTATAFSVVLANAYSWGWVFYAVPPLVGWARMYTDAHWASDVFFGFLVGWGVASLQAPRVQSFSSLKIGMNRYGTPEIAWRWRI